MSRTANNMQQNIPVDPDSGLALDPHSSWLALEERAAQTDNPRHRTLLTAVRNHMEAEIKGQLEPLMATLADQPVYHFWGATETQRLEGYDAVHTFYSDMMSRGGNQFHVVSERIVVDDNFVVTEGHVRQVHQADNLFAMGMQEVNGTAISSGQLFLGTFHLVTVWPAVEDGRLLGEDIFFAESPVAHLTEIGAEQIPEYMN